MSEADLAFLISEYENRFLEVWIWKFGLAMAFYYLAYLVGTKIKFATLIYVIAAYVVVQFTLLFKMTNIGSLRTGAFESLMELQPEGMSLTPLLEQSVLIYRPDITTPYVIAFGILNVLFAVVCLVNIGYIIYQYRLGHSNKPK